MFEQLEISESIYEGVVTLSYKKLPGKKSSVMDSVGKIEEKPHCQILTPQRIGALESAANYM